jgi:hypothetical protein
VVILLSDIRVRFGKGVFWVGGTKARRKHAGLYFQGGQNRALRIARYQGGSNKAGGSAIQKDRRSALECKRSECLSLLFTGYVVGHSKCVLCILSTNAKLSTCKALIDLLTAATLARRYIMRPDMRLQLSAAMEAFDVAREYAMLSAAAENTEAGDDALQVVLDALALATARTMAMLPPVAEDEPDERLSN